MCIPKTCGNCPESTKCSQGRCIEMSPTLPKPCDNDSPCSTLTEICVYGNCRSKCNEYNICECKLDHDCPNNYYCESGICRINIICADSQQCREGLTCNREQSHNFVPDNAACICNEDLPTFEPENPICDPCNENNPDFMPGNPDCVTDDCDENSPNFVPENAACICNEDLPTFEPEKPI